MSRLCVGVGLVMALCFGCDERSAPAGVDSAGGGGASGGDELGAAGGGKGQEDAGGAPSAGSPTAGTAAVPYLAFAGSPPTASTPVVCMEGSCEGSLQCFQVTEQFGICDRLIESTGCGECAEDTFCKHIQWHSGGPMSKDECVPNPCSQPSDCEADACVPPSFIGDAFAADASRCAPATCHADEECTVVAGGRCAAVLSQKTQQAGFSLLRVACLYPKDSIVDPSPDCPERTELPQGITCD